MSAFSTQGNNVNNPMLSLNANNSNLTGGQGFSFNTNVPQSQSYQNTGLTQGNGSLQIPTQTPSTGMLNTQNTQTSAPKTKVFGNYTYNVDANGAPYGNPISTNTNNNQNNNTQNTQTTQPTTPNPATPFQSSVNQIGNVSGQNAVGQGAANAAGLFGAMGNIAGLQPFAGGQNQGLNQSFANLSQPQSTANLQGEEGLFNTQNAIFQNAANTSAQQALQQQQIAQQGAETQAGLLAPFQGAPGSVISYPGTSAGLNTNGLGGNGLVNAGQVQGTLSAAQAIPQMQAYLGKATTDSSNIRQLLTNNPNLNSTDPQLLNQFIGYLNTGVASSAPQQELYGSLQDYIANIANVVAGGGATTNQVRDMANQMVSQYQQSGSMQDTLNYFDSLGNQSIQGYTNAISGNNNATTDWANAQNWLQ